MSEFSRILKEYKRGAITQQERNCMLLKALARLGSDEYWDNVPEKVQNELIDFVDYYPTDDAGWESIKIFDNSECVYKGTPDEIQKMYEDRLRETKENLKQGVNIVRYLKEFRDEMEF